MKSINKQIIMKRYILPVLFILIMTDCRKEVFDFPYVPINLTLGLNSDLATLGAGDVLFKTGYGVKGLIIYKDYTNNYYVFDRACTYEKDFSCAVETTTIQGVLRCPCCKSEFLVGEEADPLRGPASYPLVRYNAFVDGLLLRIVN